MTVKEGKGVVSEVDNQERQKEDRAILEREVSTKGTNV